jgi:hypothetical protein
MAHYRISMGVAVSVLLAWPLQLGVWAATPPKVVEEVDFATSCGPAAVVSPEPGGDEGGLGGGREGDGGTDQD